MNLDCLETIRCNIDNYLKLRMESESLIKAYLFQEIYSDT